MTVIKKKIILVNEHLKGRKSENFYHENVPAECRYQPNITFKNIL